MAARKQQPVLIDLPLGAKAGTTLAELAASSDKHARFFKDGFQAAWTATRRDNIAERNAVRMALIQKYKLQ